MRVTENIAVWLCGVIVDGVSIAADVVAVV